MEGKFVGGAERARRNARKRKHCDQLVGESSDPAKSSIPRYESMGSFFNGQENNAHVGESELKSECMSSSTGLLSNVAKNHVKRNDKLPKSLSPSTKFFATLLINKLEQLIHSNVDQASQTYIIQNICSRVHLPSPTKLPSAYTDATEYYSLQAALVLEESRFVLAQALSQIFRVKPGPVINMYEGGRIDHEGIVCSIASVHQLRVKKKETTFLQVHLSTDIQYCDASDLAHIDYLKKKPASIVLLGPRKAFSHVTKEDGNDHVKCNHPCLSYASTLKISSPKVGSIDSFILASIEPTFGDTILSVNVYDKQRWLHLTSSFPSSLWTLLPLTSLNKELRQFEVCMKRPKVSFMPAILGMMAPRHIRFNYDDDDDDDDDDGGPDGTCLHEDEMASNGSSTTDGSTLSHSSSTADEYNAEDHSNNYDHWTEHGVTAPVLNPSQNTAAEKFLSSPSGSITLIQGPPGTGKTTFMVSVLFRYFFSDRDQHSKRVVVTAPTNKAVAVMASRLLDSIHSPHLFPLNLVLIGVEEKLMEEDDDPSYFPAKTRNQTSSSSILSSAQNRNKWNRNKGGLQIDHRDHTSLVSPGNERISRLKHIFIYSWVENIMDTYRTMFTDFNNTLETGMLPMAERILSQSRDIQTRIHRGIPHHGMICGYLEQSDNFHNALDIVIHNNHAGPESYQLWNEISRLFTVVISCLETLRKHEVGVRDELLATANIIFCTLSTAGNGALKRTGPIDDLFVDEAAAATEPELCIPFGLKPLRMLAVGDPMQLPATVFSPVAKKLGLDTSLHERLRQNGSHESLMLNVQYRMKPCISRFPSMTFYDNNLQNGSNVLATYPFIMADRTLSFTLEEWNSNGMMRGHILIQWRLRSS